MGFNLLGLLMTKIQKIVNLQEFFLDKGHSLKIFLSIQQD